MVEMFKNAENWLSRDPEIKCFLPGVPRMMYMPYPINIVEGRDTILMASEFASASRTIGKACYNHSKLMVPITPIVRT